MKRGFTIIRQRRSNSLSSEWKCSGESECFPPAKVMPIVFWDAHGVVLIEYLEKGKKHRSVLYIIAGAIKECPYLFKKVLFPPRQGTRAHVFSSYRTTPRIALGIAATYSILARFSSKRFFSFPEPKKMPCRTRLYFKWNVTAEKKKKAYILEFDKPCYTEGIKNLEKRWPKCIIDLQGRSFFVCLFVFCLRTRTSNNHRIQCNYSSIQLFVQTLRNITSHFL